MVPALLPRSGFPRFFAALLGVVLLSALRLAAYPPAPYYTLYGVVRDQVGVTAQLVWRALALARLGRGGEALDLLALAKPQLPGSPGNRPAYLPDREVWVRAHLTEAIVQPESEEGRARRQAALDAGQKILDALSAEARELRTEGILRRWVAEERVKVS
jgi:hypothetical protein